MYIITFYSFKGGVGRTFALVNVGIELAKAGRKVLLVDFDLEAPGIHTFDALSPLGSHKGIVEFVTDYVDSRTAPDVRDYIYEPKELSLNDGRLWVMPAGSGGTEYRQRLASINWQSLYRDHGGFLLFEDLKAQWQESFLPDYVLIDSRTGHTDIEGICTRQLPDAVVALFFPNEQNLAGLKEVVADIKVETCNLRKRQDPISLHFVMSNVPDLDDEDGILRDRVKMFRRSLGCNRFSMIHNYPSLALLNQSIFTLERPRSRLSKEYRRLKDELVNENRRDPEGVIRFLKRIGSSDSLLPRRIGDIEERLHTIQEDHAKNGEIMFHLGIIRKNQAKYQEAIGFFDTSVESGFDFANSLLERATCYSLLNKGIEAAEDAEAVLSQPGLNCYGLLRLTDLIGKYRPNLLEKVPLNPSFATLDPTERFLVINPLSQYKEGLTTALSLFYSNINDGNVSKRAQANIVNVLLMSLVKAYRFQDAITLYSQGLQVASQDEIQNLFNFTMAKWAETHEVPRDLLVRIKEIDYRNAKGTEYGANYAQCLALVLGLLGDCEEALERLGNAERMIQDQDEDDQEFSCWSYRDVAKEEFLADCEAIRTLIQYQQGEPAFFLKT